MKSFLLLVAFATLSMSCREPRVEGQLSASGGLLGTWQIAIARCVGQAFADGSVVLTDQKPRSKRLTITRKASRYQLELSALSGCNGEWRTVTLSPKRCSLREVALQRRRGKHTLYSGHAAFECAFLEVGAIAGSVEFSNCR